VNGCCVAETDEEEDDVGCSKLKYTSFSAEVSGYFAPLPIVYCAATVVVTQVVVPRPARPVKV
jgi:hypothetical protein